MCKCVRNCVREERYGFSICLKETGKKKKKKKKKICECSRFVVEQPLMSANKKEFKSLKDLKKKKKKKKKREKKKVGQTLTLDFSM